MSKQTQWVPQTFYVVAFKCSENEVIEDDETVWTISTDPSCVGWNTDCSHTGYGMIRPMAEFLVDAANEKLQHIIQGYDP